MSQTLPYICRHLLAIATTVLPLCSHAQPDTAVPAHRSLEVYASRNTLSNGYGKWHEAGVRGKYAIDNHLLGAELATMRRFGESGQYFGVSDTITLNADWFTSVSVGAGDGAAYLPDYRADAFIHRKLLPSRQLVASLGAGYYRAPDDHIDRNISLGATYYFEAPWVLQGEIRFNRSNPGQVRTHQQFLAATWGQEHHTRVVLRHGWGAEGYQAIGGGASLVNFDSRQSQLNVQHWLGRQWGINMGVERYSNPFYARKGITLALFWKLP